MGGCCIQRFNPPRHVGGPGIDEVEVGAWREVV